MAATAQIASQGSVQLAGPGRASFGGALRSELTKIRSVRSTYWTLAAMVIITIGISALLSWGRIQDYASQPAFVQAHMAVEIRARATEFSMFGLILGQLVIAVLGALTITAEYSTGMIRTSLTVMPRRETVYMAKALVFTVIALVAGLVTSFGSYFIGQAIFATHHLNSSIGQPGVLRAVIGGGLFLGACGLLSFGIGALLRHTAGAITTSVALLFVVFVLGGARGQVDTAERRRRHLGEPERGEHVQPLGGVRRVLLLRRGCGGRGRHLVPHPGRVSGRVIHRAPMASSARC